ncbi:MAG: glutathione S-transferase family protein [Betaproteobacteria bacterium]|nr:glutathione S-transferase family protein [Betaproteobacteria bacterium]
MRYELYYTASNQGRGEFVRLALEEARADYVDVARESGPGRGAEAVTRLIQDAAVERPPFAQPFLKAGKLVIAQTANILLYLGPRLGLAPRAEAGRLWAHQLQLTLADLLKEIQDTHHPVAHGLYYEEQKPEALKYTRHFLAERLPKFLGYFERVLGGTKGRGCMVGRSLSYVDLSMFQLVEGLRFSFPETMQRVEPGYPGLVALHDRVAARPNVAAYLKSPRRIPFNDRGIFRHYPELEAEQ